MSKVHKKRKWRQKMNKKRRKKRKNLAIILQVFSLLSGNTIRRGTRLTFQQSSAEGSSVRRVAEVRISLKKKPSREGKREGIGDHGARKSKLEKQY